MKTILTSLRPFSIAARSEKRARNSGEADNEVAEGVTPSCFILLSCFCNISAKEVLNKNS